MNSFDDIYSVSRRKALVNEDEIIRAEMNLEGELPVGYGHFLMEYGIGTFSGYMRLLRPFQIIEAKKENTELLMHDFWDRGENIPSLELRSKMIVFADSTYGDSFAYLPAQPNWFFIFPRHNDQIFQVGSCFFDLVKWLLCSGDMVTSFKYQYFDPYNEKISIRFKIPQPYPELTHMKDIFSELGQHDYIYQTDEYLLYFIQDAGLLFHYNKSRYSDFDNYMQLFVSFDRESNILSSVYQVFQGMQLRAIETKGIDLDDIKIYELKEC
ncbi:SMI1/KNR4 family protein [Candidatus Sumerlaeota bacterium]|nr:SMI1/KNR4 family protein [Candidatus Sumerlaeota bacterium]